MGKPAVSMTALVLVLAACSEREEATTSGPSLTTITGAGTTGMNSSTGDESGEIYDVGNSSSGGSNTGGDSQCGCTNVMDGIYVLNSSPPSVWFFDPPANTFTQVGQLGCPAPLGWTANSMAVDRQGNAWLNYYNQSTRTGKMFKAPLYALEQCEELPYANPSQTWWLLGMGYSVVDANSSCDELFIYKSDKYIEYPNFTPGGSHLGHYNEANHTIEVIGETAYPVAELTGTGDGRLFAFAAVSQGKAVLVNLDKTTGQEISHQDLDIDITNAFAFAFWGGDVYLFTETTPLSGVSKVTRLDYDMNAGGGLTTYNPNTGIHIPGAGVSTCASFQPPG